MVNGNNSSAVKNLPLMWSPPPRGYVKWKVDASVSTDLQLSAIGGVLRQDNGCLNVCSQALYLQLKSTVRKFWRSLEQ